IVCEAEARGVAEEGCASAAVLGERTGRQPGHRQFSNGRSDLLPAVISPNDAGIGFGEVPSRQGDRTIERAQRQLARLADHSRPAPPNREEALLIALLAGYPDRVARRRAPRSREVLLAAGGAAVLSEQSVVREAELMIAVEAEERRDPGRAGASLIIH